MAPEGSTQTDQAFTMPPTHPPASQQGQFQDGQQPYNYQQYSSAYGKPFQPYQQQYPQCLPPDALVEERAWKWTKLGLHAADAVLCIVGIPLGLTLLNRGDAGAFAPTSAGVVCPPDLPISDENAEY